MRSLILLLTGLLLVHLVLCEPFPVSLMVDASVKSPAGPLTYRVTVTASRQVDVRVRASVIPPSGDQSTWKTLWEGRLERGETKILEASEETPPRLGSYVVWVAVDFVSAQDYMVVNGRMYYATYDVVHVLTVYEPSVERWRTLYLQALNESERYKLLYANASNEINVLLQKCKALEEEAARLKVNLSSLKTSYDQLYAECSTVKEERNTLRQLLERRETDARRLTVLLIMLASLSLILGGALVALTLSCRKAATRERIPPPPPPPPG
ncbi:MAG: hypothetical protein NZ954_04845 [Thermofilaceae archaeon]|nr:hypothetical protein [Thermofilaceae archaeon]MCX8180134.1 hypothetical protein [Thermofilaceae archaeon]MDW8004210.1 hypothetical protein [Thermofilaceae archaeon]